MAGQPLGYFMPKTLLFYFFYAGHVCYFCGYLYSFFFFSGMSAIIGLFYAEYFLITNRGN